MDNETLQYIQKHGCKEDKMFAEEIITLRAENARLRDNEQELHAIATAWMRMHDALKAKYEPSIAVLSTHPENVSKNSEEK